MRFTPLLLSLWFRRWRHQAAVGKQISNIFRFRSRKTLETSMNFFFLEKKIFTEQKLGFTTLWNGFSITLIAIILFCACSDSWKPAISFTEAQASISLLVTNFNPISTSKTDSSNKNFAFTTLANQISTEATLPAKG